eukprot:scaffold37820_cov36-Cyclotella_meneghiniana.AAC.3
MKGKKLVEPAVVSDDEDSDNEAFFLEQEISGLYDKTIWECIECYLNFPESDTPENNPLSYAYIREQQQQDQKLLALLEKYPDNYYYDNLDDDVNDVICYKKDSNSDDWKIALPDSMVPEVVTWFHQVLGHPGQTRLRHTLQQRCEHCQRYKLAGKGYGLLPERQVRIAPWEEVAIDLIGPWKVK